MTSRLSPPLFVGVTINPDAGAPQPGLAVRVKVALPSAIFVDRKMVALAGLLDRRHELVAGARQNRLVLPGMEQSGDPLPTLANSGRVLPGLQQSGRPLTGFEKRGDRLSVLTNLGRGSSLTGARVRF